MAEPILKWAGGKRQLIDELRTRFPREFDRFHEPFVGGGAVVFDLEPQDGTINDVNPRLINFYEQVRDRPDELIARCESFESPESDPDPKREFAGTDRKGEPMRNYYYQQRELFNRRPHREEFDPTMEAALFLYLNRTGYNGLYRENTDGEFNVPIGRYANPDWVRESAVRTASRVLDGIAIHNTDFESITERATAGDLVYFDPPYEPMSPTANFTDYSANGFEKEDQRRLLETATELDRKGIAVVVSNSGVTYDWYDEMGFDVEIVGATRAINSDAENRGAVDEIIATNVPPDERRAARQRKLAGFDPDSSPDGR